jgi:cobalt-zinc-cadmium efflux system outer membrane protein
MRPYLYRGVVLCVFGLVTPTLSAQTLISSSPPVAPAQTSGHAQERGVDEFLRVALERNAELLAVRQDIAAARGFLTQSRLRPNPGLDVSVFNGRPLGSPGEHGFDIGYAHTFELGGKRARRIDVAQVGVEIAELLVADRERLLRADIKTRFAEALAAARNVSTLGEIYELNARSLKVATQRVSEGEGAPLEQTLLQVEVGRIGADRLLANAAAARAFGALKLSSGIAPGEMLTLRGELTAEGVDISLDAAVERALAQRPDLKAAKAEEARAAAEQRLAQAERVPDVIGLVRYGQASTQFAQLGLSPSGAVVPLRDQDRTLTAGVSIPLPFANRNQGAIETALARQKAASLRREFIEQSVRTDVQAAFALYAGARQAAEVFDKQVMQQMQRTMTTIRTSYELGESQLLDLVQEQRRLVETQKAFTDVLKELYIARAALEAAVGGEVR